MITYIKEAQIKLNYSIAIKQASDLENVANDLEQMICTSLQNGVEELSASWKGESSNRFISKENELEQQIRSTARELRQTARTVRTIARNIYNTEMNNVRIARAMLMGL